jgi:phage shock protein PspC (stress-responsive transcriptional regulator)
MKRLFRSKKDKMFGGVCGGMADYFNIDPVIVRICWLLLMFGVGFGLLAYIIGWIIIPEDPS